MLGRRNLCKALLHSAPSCWCGVGECGMPQPNGTDAGAGTGSGLGAIIEMVTPRGVRNKVIHHH